MTPESREILRKWLDQDMSIPEGKFSLKRRRLAALWALERAEVILNNMALENTGFWASIFSRWAISDEPLRNDAAAALPEISRAIERLREET